MSQRKSGLPEADALPYGVIDVEDSIRRDRESGQVKCVLRGCEHWLYPPQRKGHRGDFCPDHGVRVHSAGTFSYADYRRNLLDAAYFHEHIRNHPFKLETHRFGQEKSEDALTYNVFRTMQKARCLKAVAELCTGIHSDGEPRLFLWGLELKADGVEPWDLLIAARDRFESDLPVNRPKTEPDIALFLPGVYVLLIEAKFCSANTFYVRDEKGKLFDLTFDQLLNIYQDKTLQILDYDAAHKRDRVYHQLWRNLTFAEWMAAAEGGGAKPFHANLVRQGYETEVCGEFLSVIRPEFQDRFEQITWEQIYGIAQRHGLELLCRYMANKTAGLKPAFQIAHSESAEIQRGDL